MKWVRTSAAAFISLCMFLLGSTPVGSKALLPAKQEVVTQRQSPTLYYLNAPETVTRSGALARFKISGRSTARIFFHFKNATGSPTVFRISIAGSAMSSAYWGIATDKEPGIAGSRAAERFLSSESRTRDPQGVSLSARVEKGATVSGIVEGIPISPTGATVTAVLGDSNHDHKDWHIQKSSFVEIAKPVQLELGKSFIVRLGDHASQPNRIDGDYGSTMKIRITNLATVPQKIRIGVSPRGGDAAFVYRIRGVVRRTNVIKVGSDAAIISIILQPMGVLTLDTIPLGGWCYPVEVRIRSRSAV